MKCGFSKCVGDGIVTRRVIITYLNPGDGDPDEFLCCDGCALKLEELVEMAARQSKSNIAYERLELK